MATGEREREREYSTDTHTYIYIYIYIYKSNYIPIYVSMCLYYSIVYNSIVYIIREELRRLRSDVERLNSEKEGLERCAVQADCRV